MKEMGDCEVSVTEDHDAIIARWESKGWIDPNCKACVDMGYYSATDPASVFAPRHLASANCKSGSRAHCTCRSCF
jgi:hypothetical protein